jgi:GSCFA family
MEDRSVLASTTYSKSVLRVAAEEVAARYEGVAYFPSFEVITGNHSRGAYFGEGLRDITEDGVSHVMRLFMRHYTDKGCIAVPIEAELDTRRELGDRVRHDLEEIVAVMCDEVRLDEPHPGAAAAPPPPVADSDRSAGAEPPIAREPQMVSSQSSLTVSQPAKDRRRGIMSWLRQTYR